MGNKLDLYGERTVSTAEGLSLARELDCPFYETSAVNRINVDDIFSGVIRKIRQRKHEDSPNNFTTMKPKIIRLRKIIGDKFRGKFTQLASLTTQPPLWEVNKSITLPVLWLVDSTSLYLSIMTISTNEMVPSNYYVMMAISSLLTIFMKWSWTLSS